MANYNLPILSYKSTQVTGIKALIGPMFLNSRSSSFKTSNIDFTLYRVLYRVVYRNLYRVVYRNLYRVLYRVVYRALYRVLYRVVAHNLDLPKTMNSCLVLISLSVFVVFNSTRPCENIP